MGGISMNPILLDIPDHIETERLYMRVRKDGDELQINEAIIETYDDLNKWMPWADHIPTLEESKEYTRTAIANFLTRKVLDFSILLKGTDTFIGSIGFPRLDWNIPKFEIGYWIRKSFQSKGYAVEAADSLTRFAFETLDAKRVEIRCDPENHKSKKIPEKLGFELEGILRKDFIIPSGEIRDTAVYAKIK